MSKLFVRSRLADKLAPRPAESQSPAPGSSTKKEGIRCTGNALQEILHTLTKADEQRVLRGGEPAPREREEGSSAVDGEETANKGGGC
jgi:hypothetical protein